MKITIEGYSGEGKAALAGVLGDILARNGFNVALVDEAGQHKPPTALPWSFARLPRTDALIFTKTTEAL